MTDRNTLAEAGTADAQPQDLRSAAMDLPDFDLGLDDEGGAEQGGEPGQGERQQEPNRSDRARQQPRGDQGRFASQGQGEQGAEGEGDAQQESGAEGEAEPPEEPEQEGEAEKEAEGDPKAKEPTLFMEIDGQRYSAEDIRRGFLRQGDYTQKTQALAQERQQFQTAAEQKAQQLHTHEQELTGVLNLAVTALQETMPPRPEMDLLRVDPIAYHEQMALHTQAVERLQGLVSHQQQAGQRMTEQQRQELARQQHQQTQTLVEAQNTLRKTMPALFTEQGRSEFFAKVETHSEALGLSRQDIDQIQDPRAFPVLDLAMKYLDLQAKKPAAVQRVQQAPPIRPAARPGAGTRDGQARRSAESEFSKDPSIKNALKTGVLDEIFG